MKKFILLAYCFLFSALAEAQQLPLIAHAEAGNVFMSHAVSPKENWYSLGRMYNVGPKDLAAFNGTTLDKVLSIGQIIKIPLNSLNFSQDGSSTSEESLVPVHHVVAPKEGLYHIGQTYNKVPLEKIRFWNKLKSDNIGTGTRIIVGYLKVVRDQSVLASAGTKVDLPPQAVQTEHKAPVVSPPITDQHPAKTESKPQIPPNKPVSEVKPVVIEKPPVASSQASNTVNTGGAFRSMYEEKGHPGNSTNINGQGAVFKSTSGWKDGKYYALMNKAIPGTIVRVTNPANNRTIYAKVLGEIPPGKENEGLIIRISNAAASELSIPDGRTELQLSWTK